MNSFVYWTGVAKKIALKHCLTTKKDELSIEISSASKL